MSDTAKPSDKPQPATTAKTDEQHHRAQVDALLARPAAQSKGSVKIGRQKIDYRVKAAFVPVAAPGLAGQRGEPEAAVLTIAYLKEGVAAAERPVCFAFNGGPGSASLWLHLGALGPKRVLVPDDGSMPVPPYAVSDNPHSWFEHFDMVFIDPPHTGWSLTANDAARKRMLGVDGDVDALAEVMRWWLTHNRRWGSRLYLAGESYGTTRGAALADKLQDLGALLSGVILVSLAMDLQTIVFSPANDLPYALFLPAFANVAQYHGLLGGSIGESSQAAREAAEAFVQDEYAAALQAGSRLSAAQTARIAKRVAELTGLPRPLVEDNNLRISDRTFFAEAMRSRGRVVGRLDARATAPMGATRGREMEFDPGIEAIAAPYTMATMAYYAELGLDLPQRYEIISHEVNSGWTWARGGGEGGSGRMTMGFTSTTPDLARALRRNPQLKVLCASGRYDLGTPYSASDWSLAHLDITAEVQQRVTHRYYDAGHMMYTRQADLKRLKADLAAWLAA
jgi:carboxypeptidase C (cathepsin A)